MLYALQMPLSQGRVTAAYMYCLRANAAVRKGEFIGYSSAAVNTFLSIKYFIHVLQSIIFKCAFLPEICLFWRR